MINGTTTAAAVSSSIAMECRVAAHDHDEDAEDQGAHHQELQGYA